MCTLPVGLVRSSVIVTSADESSLSRGFTDLFCLSSAYAMKCRVFPLYGMIIVDFWHSVNLFKYGSNAFTTFIIKCIHDMNQRKYCDHLLCFFYEIGYAFREISRYTVWCRAIYMETFNLLRKNRKENWKLLTGNLHIRHNCFYLLFIYTQAKTYIDTGLRPKSIPNKVCHK